MCKQCVPGTFPPRKEPGYGAILLSYPFLLRCPSRKVLLLRCPSFEVSEREREGQGGREREGGKEGEGGRELDGTCMYT